MLTPSSKTIDGVVSIAGWVKEQHFSPPISNRVLFQGHDFTVMIVCGPNARRDYHVNGSGEEWFYQVQGELVLRVRGETNAFRDVLLQEGCSYLLPAGLPHKPIRPAGTIGIVVEKTRQAADTDELHWYCEGCTELIHKVSFHCYNLEGALQRVLCEANIPQVCPHCGVKV